MKYGYSALLSETVEAARIGYSDCRSFQVVCPICREPVFKGMREQPAIVHYLSHYPAAAAYAAECELRVGRFNAREIEQQNLISRGQKLELFLRVLRAMIERCDYGDQDPNKTKTLFRILEKSKPMQFMREMLVDSRGVGLLDESIFMESAHHYIHEDVGADSAMWRTGFSLETQQRIAFDVWRTLWTPPALGNLRHLWNQGYLMVLWRLQCSLNQGVIDAPQRQLRRYAETLVQSSREGGMQIMSEMARTEAPQPFAEPGSNYFVKLNAEVTHEMIGCLLRLPYFEVLKEHQKS